MVKKMICEISESDFRKLGLTGRAVFWKESPSGSGMKRILEPVSIEDELDKAIRSIMESGNEEDLELLKIPVTVAIHEPGDGLDGCYMDKYLNCFSGPRTFQIGFGIPHLYSTRNWLEARDGDYWRVSKAETKAVYRVTLDPKWAESFVVKHRVVRRDWPYDVLPDGVSPDYLSCELAVGEDLGPDGWETRYRVCEVKYDGHDEMIPVDEEGKRISIGRRSE